MSTTYISVSNTLQRLHTLHTSRDSLSAQRALLPIDHYLGGLAGYHYVAFTKTLLVHSCSLGFASRTNTVHLPMVGDEQNQIE
jgi:nitrate reductase gamma subunit